MTFRTPGVYILESPSFPPSVVPVETAIPVFIGFTEKIPPSNTNDPLKPVKIFDLEEFESLFGQIDHSRDFTYTVNALRDGNNVITSIETSLNVENDGAVYNYNLYHALSLYLAMEEAHVILFQLGYMLLVALPNHSPLMLIQRIILILLAGKKLSQQLTLKMILRSSLYQS